MRIFFRSIIAEPFLEFRERYVDVIELERHVVDEATAIVEPLEIDHFEYDIRTDPRVLHESERRSAGRDHFTADLLKSEIGDVLRVLGPLVDADEFRTQPRAAVFPYAIRDIEVAEGDPVTADDGIADSPDTRQPGIVIFRSF